jgi:hypothetical protein
MGDDIVETLLHAPNISVSVLMGRVSIEIDCASDYEAQVLFDDLSERLSAGQEISITPTPKAED